MPTFDVGGLVVGSAPKKALLYMKSPGVFAGKPFVDAVFDILDCKVTWENIAVEGTFINPAEKSTNGKVVLATVEGPANLILRGERTALNTISRCSGVATSCYLSSQRMKQMFPDWTGAVAGTRKTTPGSFRIVEKYGLIIGGCNTHRLDLSQMTMLKDNHIWSCGGDITKAVKKAAMRAGNPRNQGNVGTCQRGQGGNFACCIHAHFLNGKIAISGKCGKGNWHADMVVKAALAGMGFAKSG